MEQKVVPGPLAVIDSIFILFISSVYLCTTKGYTGFQGIILGILIVIGFNILLRIKYVGTVILVLSSITWAFGIFSLLPLEKLVNNSLPWKIGVFLILLLLSLAFHFKPVDEKKDLTPEQAAALDSYNQAVELAKIQKEIQKENEKKIQKQLKKEQKAKEKDAKKNGGASDKQKSDSNYVNPSSIDEDVKSDSKKMNIKDMQICPVISKRIPNDGIYCIPFFTYCITYLDVVNEKFLTNDSVNYIDGFNSKALADVSNTFLMNNYEVCCLEDEDEHMISLDSKEEIHGAIFAYVSKDNTNIFCGGASLMASDAFLSKVGAFLENGFYYNPISNDYFAIFDEKLFDENSLKQHILNNSDDQFKDFKDLFYYDFNNHQINYIPIQ